MPAKNTKSRKTSSKKPTIKPSLSWRQRLFATRFGKPALFAIAFMVIGAATIWWVSAATTTYGLWSDSKVPRTLSVADTRSAQLGLRFKSKVAGYVTGVRFYKSVQNTGTHTGNLWDSQGNLLASVKFSNETASGWQSAAFSNPVSIAANVNYVVSYNAPNGHYSQNAKYFASNTYTNQDLVAPRNTSTNPNGVINTASGASTFPADKTGGANYWVDVSFTTKLINPQPAPAAPTNLAVNAGSSNVSLSWAASIAANGIDQYVIYRDGGKLATVSGTTLTYTDNAVTAGTTYSYQVQAIDTTGQASVLSAVVSATVPSSGGSSGGASGSTTCPLPNYPTPSCTGVPANTNFSRTVTGSYIASTAGEVIDGWDITGDLLITADNVVVKNTQVGGTVRNNVPKIVNGVKIDVYLPFTISDSTVGPASGCVVAPGVGEGEYTATRVYVRGHDDGFRMSGNNVTVTDSFAKLCYAPASVAPPDGSHSDGVQAVCGDGPCSGLVFNHNTLDARSIPATRSINLVDPNLSVVTAKDNLLAGGAYIIDTQWHSGPKWLIQDNRIVDQSWAYGPVTTEGTCSSQTWSGNSIVAIDTSYNITGTVKQIDCVE